MNLFIKYIFFIAIDIYIFRNFGKLCGFLGLGIIIYRLLNLLGFLRTPKIYRGFFNEGVAYLKDYKGKYFNPNAFKESLELIKKFNLENFVLIGIYYDRPGNIPETEYRCSIGIYKKNVGFANPVPKEFEEYCEKNNYYFAELPSTSSVYSDWEYTNHFVMMMGILKFYKIIKLGLEDASFRKMYKISEKSKICIELYLTESKMEFYIPLANEEKYMLYRKEDDKPKSQ